ncbi:PREDICTED: uncharacterized protein C16orf59 homolog [Chrysochloris asiatica]|uniref:Uncharacterized protein C16orf59 homolog n=1 Tax=Chrysochloris asiatica TaxID=185453 RepID=A0A9B0TZ38_CHRAS|nr:PREDICTED: uncharacterized protein C16orf59 homolog [Chrysochloris asiatica]
MLPAECSRRLVTELRGALDACAERQQQLDQSLRGCRRLLRAWEPTGPPAPASTPGPETKKEDQPPACAPSPQDVKELELLTQALAKAVRVRKGVSRAGQGHKAPNLKPRTSATRASTPSQAPGQPGSRTSKTKPRQSIHQPKVPAKDHPEVKLLPGGQRTTQGTGVGASGPSIGDSQVAPEAFTLKEKGTLLRLPAVFQRAVSKNSGLWTQICSTETSSSASAAARARFLRKMRAASGLSSGSGLSAAEVEAEVEQLWHACSLLKLCMRNELAAAPTHWLQEYRRLLMLEGLQAMVGQCLHRLQELQEVVAEEQLESRPSGMPRKASLPCGGEGAPKSPQPLLYSSTQELQALTALRLRIAMLRQQLHLQKVLIAELLPLASVPGPYHLALCRAAYSLLCEGSQRFPAVLRDQPAD